MAPRTSRSKQSLPDDILIDNILSQLPVKSRIRFRCVSKSWFSNITNPIFITKHFNLSKNHYHYHHPTTKVIYYAMPSHFFTLGKNTCVLLFANSDPTLITEISRFRIPFPNASIIGFCNGIFCLLEYRIIRNVCSFPSNPTYYLWPYLIIYLWNSSIRNFKRLPYARLNDHFDNAVAYGLGYQSQNNDFKVYLDGLSLMFEQLVVFKGLLASIAFGKAEDEIGLIKECRMSVMMREYGVVESWSQIVVGPFQDVGKFFGCTGSGELVFSRDLKILNKYNLGIEDLEPKFYTADLMESLVLLKE